MFLYNVFINDIYRQIIEIFSDYFMGKLFNYFDHVVDGLNQTIYQL